MIPKELVPPRLAERLLHWSMADSEWRDAVVGDLHEEFVACSRRQGRSAATQWYWQQALRLTARFATGRLLHRHPATRPWIAPPDTGDGGGMSLGTEVRHAWRSMTQRPSLAIVIVASLALAMAANATVFSLLDALALRPFRFDGVERLVLIASDEPQNPLLDRETVAPADLADWRRQARTVTSLSAVEWWEPNFSGVEHPEQLPGFRVSPSFFEILGVRPAAGRFFLPEEEVPGADRRAVISHTLWTRRFAADPAVIGRTMKLDGELYEVVGVAPEGFGIPLGSQVWSPYAPSAEGWNDRKSERLMVIGRLAEGRTLEDVRHEFGAITERLAGAHPDTNAKRPIRVETFNKGMADPGAGTFIAVAQGAALLLLVIACANTANLLLARGAERAHEYSLRLALGASRVRLAGVTVLEGVVLALGALLLSLPLAYASIGAVRAAFPAAIIRFVPGWEHLGLNVELFAVTAMAAFAAAVAFSIAPALHASRAALSETLRQSGRTTTTSKPRLWLRNALAAAQVAISLALLCGAGLALAASDRAIHGNLGFDKRNVLVASVLLPDRPYGEAGRRRQFVETAIEKIRAIPAVASAAVGNRVPYDGGTAGLRLRVEGSPLGAEELPRADYRRVSPEFFEVLRIPLLTGRGFTDLDGEGSRDVGLISRGAADRFWPGADPIGQRFQLGENGAWVTVVGIVGDVRQHWVQPLNAPAVYRPVAQDPSVSVAFAVRTIGDPIGVATALRQAIGQVDPDLPLQRAMPLEELMVERTTGLIFIARLVAVVALIAAVLAVTGLYSLMTFLASRREREIGVRIALGASRWDVIRSATLPAIRITGAGIAVGVVLSLWVARLMESAMLGAVSGSPLQLAAIAVILLAVALVAAYVPARRAAGLDATTALRAE